MLQDLYPFKRKASESVGQGLPISEFSTRSAGFADYLALTREVLEQESSKKEVSSATETASEELMPDSKDSCVFSQGFRDWNIATDSLALPSADIL